MPMRPRSGRCVTGTGSVSCNSVFVLHLCRLLNQEELMEREAMLQNPSSHCRDLTCRKMHPNKVMHNPVDVQSFLEASCVLGIHIGLPPIGRTPASQRRMEGPAGAFAQEYTVMHNTLSDNKLYGHGKASQYCISDLTVL